MQQTKQLATQPVKHRDSGGSHPLQILLSLVMAAVLFYLLWQGFLFLRDSNAPKWIIAIVAIIWGVGGVAALYFVANRLIELMPGRLQSALMPYLFVGPAMALLIWYLALPTVRTFWFSLLDRNSTNFVGIQNYIDVFTQRLMLEAFRNNLLWLAVGATSSVVIGLLVAVLADRSRFENLAK